MAAYNRILSLVIPQDANVREYMIKKQIDKIKQLILKFYFNYIVC